MSTDRFCKGSSEGRNFSNNKQVVIFQELIVTFLKTIRVSFAKKRGEIYADKR